MIHQYKLNGYNIILDVYSNAIHIVDDIAYDIISLYKNKSIEDLKEIILKKYKDLTLEDLNEYIQEICEIESSGKLFSDDIYKDVELNVKNADTLKALCLHISHTCNLSCEYCFASQGNFKGDKALMSFEVGKKALDFLIENSKGRRNLEVDFFGGEPLMNWDVVKNLVKYAREQEKIHNKNFRFTLTTNGVLIDDDIIEFSNKEMHNIVLSLDGRKEVHDHFRKDYAGKGSYDKVVPKFLDFVNKRDGKNYYMRGTFTRNNLDFTKDIMHMYDLGFKELSMEPVVCEVGDKNELQEKDKEILFEQYEILAKKMIELEKKGDGFTFYHYILDLKHGPCIHKRVSGCGSGTEYLAVTPWGEFFPCHQFVSDKKYSMGNVDIGVINKVAQEEFKNCNIYTKDECKECWAKLYCCGGCAANSYHVTGDIKGIYKYGCDLFKKRIECAIMMQVALSES